MEEQEIKPKEINQITIGDLLLLSSREDFNFLIKKAKEILEDTSIRSYLEDLKLKKADVTKKEYFG